MATWAELEHEAPDLARAVRQRFDAHRHKLMATLRKDGSPRISGVEVAFHDGQLWVAGMPSSRKFLDLRRDPRIAVHSGSDEPETWTGDAKVGGRAAEITEPAELAAFAEGTGATEAGQFQLFRVDLTEAVEIAVGKPADHLVIESWVQGRGLRRVERR
jgi:Pyridoxamine 5'-phosphate oxidase